jgi:hypothetical protein
MCAQQLWLEVANIFQCFIPVRAGNQYYLNTNYKNFRNNQINLVILKFRLSYTPACIYIILVMWHLLCCELFIFQTKIIYIGFLICFYTKKIIYIYIYIIVDLYIIVCNQINQQLYIIIEIFFIQLNDNINRHTR